MAKGIAHCTCKKCGKEFTREAFKYNRAEATRWEAWAVEYYDECGDCYAARKAAEREAENQAAAEAAKEQALPELTGSPKQIAWAETIRQKYIAAIDQKIEEIKSSKLRRVAENRSEMLGEAQGFREWLLTHTDSRFWIDNRDIDSVYPWYSIRMKMLLSDYKLLKEEGRLSE